LKLEYFQKQEWEAEWITVAERLVRDEYAKYQSKDDANASTECEEAPNDPRVHSDPKVHHTF